MSAQEGRGRPLRFLLLLLVCWCGVRMATWTSPWPQGPDLANGRSYPAKIVPKGEEAAPEGAADNLPMISDQVEVAVADDHFGAVPVPALPPPPLLAPLPPRPEPSPFASGRTAASHNFLWMAAMAALPMPQSVADWLDRRQGSQPAGAVPVVAPNRVSGPRTADARSNRWHFDGWFQWRPGAQDLAPSPTDIATLGGSQGGVMARWRLAPGAAAPSVILRATGSPATAFTPARGEVAVGLRARPLASLPLDVQAELRAVRQGGRTDLAPAAFVVGGFDEKGIVGGVKLRGYGAAGWVGGDAGTAFAEGQLLAERNVAARGDLRVDAGLGAWGGVQRGAGRADIGPSLSLRLPVGSVSARLQADYRVRVAGDARPGSGPAITLSTGF